MRRRNRKATSLRRTIMLVLSFTGVILALHLTLRALAATSLQGESLAGAEVSSVDDAQAPLSAPSDDSANLELGQESSRSERELAGKDLLYQVAQVLLDRTETSQSGKYNESSIPIEESNAYGLSKLDPFPDDSSCRGLDEEAEYVPEIIHIPFEEAIAEVTLQGWEEEWQANAKFDSERWGTLEEPKIDFVYAWVNGSDDAFRSTKHDYELNSTLNDAAGEWLKTHGVNRYRDWDELRYSFRSIEKYAGTFLNTIQVLVNAVKERGSPNDTVFTVGKQSPTWLNHDEYTRARVQVISQEEFFRPEEAGCLPTFNSLTIENQIYNTESDVDRFYALSDDMVLGKAHVASDIYSPLFGPTMGFKVNAYNTLSYPTEADARRFGEKPFLIWTSYLLNRRFGERKRKGQAHFGHSLSRSVTREAISTFPQPSIQAASQRFRGEQMFQLYPWYATFHYTMERHREALIWSYIMLRSDKDDSGNLSWKERRTIMVELEEGMANEGKHAFRERIFYRVPHLLSKAGLEPPKVNIDILWTSLDGPAMIRDLECWEFNVDECLAPGFSSPISDARFTNPIFSTASIFHRLAHQDTHCGDCFIKLILNRVRSGLSPMLPRPGSQGKKRTMVVKALMKYQYTIIEPDALFVMVTDAEQIESILLERYLQSSRSVGQFCLNDDVATENEEEVRQVQKSMWRFYQGLFPEKSSFEK